MFNSSTSILFVSYGGGHVNMILPIIKALQKYPNIDVNVLGLTTAGHILKKAQIPSFGFQHILGKSDQRALEIGKKLAKSVKSNLVSNKETYAYLGLSYIDLENRLGIKKAQEQYQKLGRMAFLPISILERFFNKFNPDLLIATNSPRAEQAAFIVAKKRKIPSICLVDMFGLQEFKWICEPGYTNKVCVFSQYTKNIFVKGGMKSEDVIVTGNPAFDSLAKGSSQKKVDDFRNKKGWKKNKVILWASQPEPQHHPFTNSKGDPKITNKIEKELFSIVSKYPNWRLVIRLHPSEPNRFNQLPSNIEVSLKDENLAILLQSIDTVVTMTSTVGLEAALLGKPMVALNLSVFSPDAPFSQMGLARGVNCLTELEDALLDTLVKRWEPNAKLPKIGKATNNVIKVIEEFLQ